MKIVKALSLLITAVVIAIGCYSWGFYCAEQDLSSKSYEKDLMSLSVSILMLDNADANQHESSRAFIEAGILNEFESMIELHTTYGFETSELVRCANTRRVREMIQEDKLFNLELSSDAQKYLETECLGNPSHKNWATDEKL